MELVLEYKGLSLIKKYDKYYIRFIGGQREEYPCDLAISNKEAMSVISSNEAIKNVRDLRQEVGILYRQKQIHDLIQEEIFGYYP